MVLLLPFCIAPLRVAHAQKPPAAPVADGDPKVAARAEVQKAQVHYKLGRFDQALEAYSRAYELFSAPALLFNIGQCHRNLKNYERALFFFEGYLREETKADAQKRTLAQELIAEARAELERQRTATAAAEAESRRAAAATRATQQERAQRGANNGSDRGSSSSSSSVAAVFGAPKAPASGVPSLLDDPPSPQVDKPITRKWWFWTALGVGAAGLAAGVLTYYATAPTTTVLPGGSVGTLDRR